MHQTIEELESAYGIPGLTFATHQGGLIRGVVETSRCTAEFFLHGAHVTRFCPAGERPVLWTSGASTFAPGKAIRGGIPICFPWFGPHASDANQPSHGTARIATWRLTASSVIDDSITVTLQTTINEFYLRYEISFNNSLDVALDVCLDGNADGPKRYESALHSYFAISDIRNVEIHGLADAPYVDKVDNATEKPPSGKPIGFHDEFDRVYLNTADTCRIVDENWGRTIQICKSNSLSTIVWNPWVAKAARMTDFGDHEWPELVCIETANVGSNAITLTPNQSHRMSAKISLQRASA